MEYLLEKYKDNTDLFDKVVIFMTEQLEMKHPDYKVGQLISFMGGYNNDINYITKIIGFTGNQIYVYWDCYWFPITNEPSREIEILTKEEFSNRMKNHINKITDIKLINSALNELNEILE
jgi:hypothetical protein